MTKQKGFITAIELHHQLAQDEEFKLRKAKKQEELNIMSKKRAEAEEALVKDVRQVGFDISSIYDFVNTANNYSGAIPILVHYLQKDLISEPIIKEGIIRALTVKEAKGIANSALLSAYNKIPKNDNFLDQNLRWLIGNAINIIIEKNDIDKVIEIVTNQKNGQSRQMFVRALSKIRSERAEDALIQLLDDRELVFEALTSLSRLKSLKAAHRIRELLNVPDTKVRKEAEKALRKIVK